MSSTPTASKNKILLHNFLYSLEEKVAGDLTPRMPLDGSMDLLRYLLGAVPFKLASNLGAAVVNFLRDGYYSNPVDGKYVISETNQKLQRVPFRQIKFLGDRAHPQDNFTFRSEAVIDVQFRFELFYSMEGFLEFIERGDTEGPILSDIRERYDIDFPGLVEKVEQTLDQLNILKDENNLTFTSAGGVTSASGLIFNQSDLQLDYFVGGTGEKLRQAGTLGRDAQLIITPNYNYYAGYDVGTAAPGNKLSLVDEKLLPSIYTFVAYEESEPPYRSELRRFLTLSMTRAIRTLSPVEYIADYTEAIKIIQRNVNFPDMFPNFKKLNTNFLVDQSLSRSMMEDFKQFPVANKIILRSRSNVEFRRDPAFEARVNRMLANNFLDQECLLRFATFSQEDINRHLENHLARDLTLFEPSRVKIIEEEKEVFKVSWSNFLQNPIFENMKYKKIDFDVFYSSLTHSRAFNLDNFSTIFDGTPGVFINKPEEVIELLARRLTMLENSEFITPQKDVTFFDKISDGGRMDFVLALRSGATQEELLEKLQQIAEEHRLTAEDVFKNTPQYYEVLGYKIIKTNYLGEKQNFFIFNNGTTTQLYHIDSQLKLNTMQEEEDLGQGLYTYEIVQYILTMETQYAYVSGREVFSTPDESLRDLTLRKRIHVYQKFVVYEVPVSEPIVSTVIDNKSPNKPDVGFFGLKDINNKVKIKLTNTAGRREALPIAIKETDREVFDFIREFDDRDGDTIVFEGEDVPSGFEIFRLSHPPTAITDFANADFYQKIMFDDDSGEDSILLENDLDPNQEYYFLFRTIDLHNNISNPTDIFKLVLVDESGALNPLLTTYPIDPLSYKMQEYKEKEFRRFFYLKPSFGQTYMPREQFEGFNSSQIRNIEYGDRSLFEDGTSSIIDNKFLIEVISKKTGKVIYIELEYEKDNGNLITTIPTDFPDPEDYTIPDDPGPGDPFKPGSQFDPDELRPVPGEPLAYLPRPTEINLGASASDEYDEGDGATAAPPFRIFDFED